MIPGQATYRIVLDTNVLLRGILNGSSADGRLVAAIQDRAYLVLLSRPVMNEYRAVLTDEEIVGRFPALTATLVGTTLKRLEYLGEFIRHPGVRFEFRRDPRDAMFVELGIAGRATHVVTNDNDLLSLPMDHLDAGRRLRQRLRELEILKPAEFHRRTGGPQTP